MRTQGATFLLVAAALFSGPLASCSKTLREKEGSEPAATAPAQERAGKEKERAEPRPSPAAEPKAPMEPPMLAGAHILIAYKGAMRAAPDVTRSKEEAKKLAQELAEKARRAPDTLGGLAARHSACPSKDRGGSLGTWRKGQMVPAFDEAIEKLKVGEVSGVVETPFGFHIIRRLDLPPMLSGSHILVAYKGAMRAAPDVTRSKEEAKKLARELAEKARRAPDTIGELAARHSACPSRNRGGSLGTWSKGQMMPAFDEAIEKLKVGEVSGVVETPFGFHIIRRDEVKTEGP